MVRHGARDGQLGNIEGTRPLLPGAPDQRAAGGCRSSRETRTAASAEQGQHRSDVRYPELRPRSIMRSSAWSSTAIFLGLGTTGEGFTTTSRRDRQIGQGWGLRVPSLVISPYARAGYIDHHFLSQDAYLSSSRTTSSAVSGSIPRTDGRPDPRPDVPRIEPLLGNLANDFNFNRCPLPPLSYPAADPPFSQRCVPRDLDRARRAWSRREALARPALPGARQTMRPRERVLEQKLWSSRSLLAQAPLTRLSQARKRTRPPRSDARSGRMRPTRMSSVSAAAFEVGRSVRRTPGAASRSDAACLGVSASSSRSRPTARGRREPARAPSSR